MSAGKDRQGKAQASGYVRVRLGAWVESGEKNPGWKGEDATKKVRGHRAVKLYPLEPCEICGSVKSERHHRDRNNANNERMNIQFLCRKHHMAVDGRAEKMRVAAIERNKQGLWKQRKMRNGTAGDAAIEAAR